MCVCGLNKLRCRQKDRRHCRFLITRTCLLSFCVKSRISLFMYMFFPLSIFSLYFLILFLLFFGCECMRFHRQTERQMKSTLKWIIRLCYWKIFLTLGRRASCAMRAGASGTFQTLGQQYLKTRCSVSSKRVSFCNIIWRF